MIDDLIYVLSELGLEQLFRMTIAVMGKDEEKEKLANRKFTKSEKVCLDEVKTYLTKKMRLTEAEAIGFIARLHIPVILKMLPKYKDLDAEAIIKEAVVMMGCDIEVF